MSQKNLPLFGVVGDSRGATFLRGLGLCSLPLAPSAPCPAYTPAPWQEGASIFSKVGGLSLVFPSEVCMCLRVPRVWHARECVCA